MGRGMGGGGLTLLAQQGAGVRDAAAWLDVAPDDWVLLCARYRSGGDRYFGWYKITATEPAPRPDPAQPNNTGRKVRQIAISGPDWEFIPAALQVVLVSNVLNVYTTTMELNLSPLWAR